MHDSLCKAAANLIFFEVFQEDFDAAETGRVL